MKAYPLLLSVLLCVAQVQAGDYKKKDADQLASENLSQAKNMFEEAKHHQARAAASSPEDAEVLNKFAQLTFEEAEWLQKSGEAFEKKQIRLGERYQEKARELCDKRGKLSEKITAIYKKDCADKTAKSEKDTGTSQENKIAEIEKKEAQLAAEKKRLLGQE